MKQFQRSNKYKLKCLCFDCGKALFTNGPRCDRCQRKYLDLSRKLRSP